MVVDTHAGAGLYRLDSDFADTSGEAATGVVTLLAALAPAVASKAAIKEIAPLLQDYVETIADFNASGQLKVYPGSPFIVQRLLRDEARDKLKLFEMHPTDSKVLAANVAQLKAAFTTAEQTGRRAPANEDAFIELENTWSHIRQLIERLPLATDDPDVKKFLRAVNSRDGATLDMLNAAVQLWLEENKSTHKYRIHNI